MCGYTYSGLMMALLILYQGAVTVLCSHFSPLVGFCFPSHVTRTGPVLKVFLFYMNSGNLWSVSWVDVV